MKSKIVRKILAAVLVAAVCVGVVGLMVYGGNRNSDKVTIIATAFPGYDFARAITEGNDDVEVEMLLKPGAETHDFEPTPQDIKNIQNSDMFVYVGGESDAWIDGVLENLDTSKTKVVKLMDLVGVVEEETVEGMEEPQEGSEANGSEGAEASGESEVGDENEDGGGETEEVVEYDEHVWTSPTNAMAIIERIKDEIVVIDEENAELYENNADNYIAEITNIDSEIRGIVEGAKRKELIFGDRFPLRYFVDEYGLDYYAAFPGCAEQTEASTKTVSFLIDKVKKDGVPVVFKIELSDGKIAETIAKETGAKVLQFNAAHNISQEDFDAGVTYADIMRGNAEVLKEALN